MTFGRNCSPWLYPKCCAGWDKVFSPLYFIRRSSLRRAVRRNGGVPRLPRKGACRCGCARFPFADVFFIGVDVAEIRRQRATAAEIRELARRIGKEQGELWAIYAGTLGNNYDIETLLAAAELLAARNVPAAIIIAGDGPLRRTVEDFVAKQDLRTIRFVGLLPTTELERYYQLCDVGLCPYLKESTVAMPIKAYDYLAAGLPIINSLQGELARLIREGSFGAQYTPGAPETLCGVLSDLARDSERLKMLTENANRAAMQFDKGAQYPRMVAFVEKVCAGSGMARVDARGSEPS